MPGSQPGPQCLLSLPLFLTISTTIVILVILLSTTAIPQIDLIHFDINVDGVNGIISLGTFGYCLHMPNNNRTCSSHDIGRFKFLLSNYPILIFCVFKGKSQIHNLVPFDSVDYKLFIVLSISALVATLCSVGTSIYAYRHVQDPQRAPQPDMNRLQNPQLRPSKDPFVKVARYIAGFGILTLLSLLLFLLSIMIDTAGSARATGVGLGFWFTILAIVLLVSFYFAVKIVWGEKGRSFDGERFRATLTHNNQGNRANNHLDLSVRRFPPDRDYPQSGSNRWTT